MATRNDSSAEDEQQRSVIDLTVESEDCHVEGDDDASHHSSVKNVVSRPSTAAGSEEDAGDDSGGGDDCTNMEEEDIEETNTTSAKRTREPETLLSEQKKKAKKGGPLDDGDDDDGEDKETEVEEVFVEKKLLNPSSSSGGGDGPEQQQPEQESAEEDDHVEVLGSTGKNALSDFPHSREHCIVHPLSGRTAASATDPRKHCPICYCYVCDKPVADCSSWDEHCRATHADPKWRQARAERSSSGAAAAAAAAGSSSSASSASRYGYGYRQTYQPPASVKQLLDGVTRIYPSEVAPPQPAFTTNLYHYQKQSLAFLLDIEQQGQEHSATTTKQKSAWLASEVGMGKSAVVIALVATHPMPSEQQPTVDDVKLASRTKNKQIKVKATVVYTSASLLGQWEDEVKKHAPSLRVYRHHSASKMRIVDLADADIVVTTATFKWATVLSTSFEYHRIVVDESHLMGSSSFRTEYVLALESERRLCVTATPFTSSFSDLDRQITFLALEHEESGLSRMNFLKRYMIRHKKSQMINGALALALPKSTTTTKMVPMTAWERETFDDAVREHDQWIWRQWSAQTRILEMRWYAPLAKPIMCEDSTKLELLKADLRELLKREPNMRTVVYTQFLQQQSFAKKAVQSLGLKTYCINGSVEPARRDKFIREFQSLESEGPAVFLITIRTGSVGITLTAASHVFLLEPCIDTATEFQAAGRIHRLGQTKQVGVTKYVFQDSCESNILELQEKVESGKIEYTTGLLTRSALEVLRVPDPPDSPDEVEREREKEEYEKFARLAKLNIP